METFKQLIRDLDARWTTETSAAMQTVERKNRSGPTVEVAEVYSLPRMTQMAKQVRMKAGFALDLTTTDDNGVVWDLSKANMREKALKLQMETEPIMLILSPPCTMLSSLQNINKARSKSPT